jgi:hypothetical protein
MPPNSMTHNSFNYALFSIIRTNPALYFNSLVFLSQQKQSFQPAIQASHRFIFAKSSGVHGQYVWD